MTSRYFLLIVFVSLLLGTWFLAACATGGSSTPGATTAPGTTASIRFRL